MDPLSVMEALSAAPDSLIIGLGDEALKDLNALLEGVGTPVHDDPADVISLAQMIHAQMVWRDRDLDALDLFTRMNSLVKHHLRPAGLMEMPYSEYVDHLREINPFAA